MEITYKIIGGDGREYGPATLAELQDWIRDGRVGTHTHVWQNERAIWTSAGEHPELQEFFPPPLVEVAFEPVGFWVRLGAYILDNILLSIAMKVITLPWGEKFAALQKGFDPSGPQMSQEKIMELGLVSITYCLIYLTLSMAYYVLLNGRFGATVGKLVVGANIVNEDGSPLGYTRALVRYAGECLSFILVGIGYLMIGFRHDKRGLHDLIARTRVIYRR